MLRIIFGDTDNSIYDTATYFDNTFENDWITEELAKEIIKDVDRSIVQGPLCIYSEAFQTMIPPVMLSGGVKTLLLLMNDDSYIFNVSTCGDNCAKWILKIAETKDITVNLYHIMDFGNDDFEALIVNDNCPIHNYHEFVTEALKYI